MCVRLVDASAFEAPIVVIEKACAGPKAKRNPTDSATKGQDTCGSDVHAKAKEEALEHPAGVQTSGDVADAETSGYDGQTVIPKRKVRLNGKTRHAGGASAQPTEGVSAAEKAASPGASPVTTPDRRTSPAQAASEEQEKSRAPKPRIKRQGANFGHADGQIDKTVAEDRLPDGEAALATELDGFKAPTQVTGDEAENSISTKLSVKRRKVRSGRVGGHGSHGGKPTSEAASKEQEKSNVPKPRVKRWRANIGSADGQTNKTVAEDGEAAVAAGVVLATELDGCKAPTQVTGDEAEKCSSTKLSAKRRRVRSGRVDDHGGRGGNPTSELAIDAVPEPIGAEDEPVGDAADAAPSAGEAKRTFLSQWMGPGSRSKAAEVDTDADAQLPQVSPKAPAKRGFGPSMGAPFVQRKKRLPRKQAPAVTDSLGQESPLGPPAAAEPNTTQMAPELPCLGLPPGTLLPERVEWDASLHRFKAQPQDAPTLFAKSFSARTLGPRKALTRAFLHAGHGRLLRSSPWHFACSCEPWCDRHEPESVRELVPQLAWSRLGAWLQNWQRVESRSEEVERVAVVVGRPGSGKSAGVRHVGQSMGKVVVEHSLTDFEGLKGLDNVMKRQSTHGQGAVGTEMLVFDVPDEPAQGLKDKLTIVIRAPTCPIVFICGDATLAALDKVWTQKHRHLVHVAPEPSEVARVLETLAKREGLKAMPESCGFIAKDCGGDLRNAITRVQLLSTTSDGEAPVELPPAVLSLPTACGRLLRAEKEGMAAVGELMELDESMAQLVQENHLAAYVEDEGELALEACAAAAEAFAMSDVAESFARGAAWGGGDEARLSRDGFLLNAVCAISARGRVAFDDVRPIPAEPEPCPVCPAAIAKLSAELNLPKAYLREQAAAWLLQRSAGANVAKFFKGWILRQTLVKRRGSAVERALTHRDAGPSEEAKPLDQEEDSRKREGQENVKGGEETERDKPNDEGAEALQERRGPEDPKEFKERSDQEAKEKQQEEDEPDGRVGQERQKEKDGEVVAHEGPREKMELPHEQEELERAAPDAVARENNDETVERPSEQDGEVVAHEGHGEKSELPQEQEELEDGEVVAHEGPGEKSELPHEQEEPEKVDSEAAARDSNDETVERPSEQDARSEAQRTLSGIVRRSAASGLDKFMIATITGMDIDAVEQVLARQRKE